MNHSFKQSNIQRLEKTNKVLLGICCALALASILLAFSAFMKEERWVLIPMTSPDIKIPITSGDYSKIYLKEWALHVMKTLMNTSSETVENQVEEIKEIAKNSEALESFLKSHMEFVRSSQISSVFYPKEAKFEEGAVVVSGLFRYWLGSSQKSISAEKTYRLFYTRGPKELLFLTKIEEVKGCA